MPLFLVTVGREVERAVLVTQQADILVEAVDQDSAYQAVENLSCEDEELEDYCRWADEEESSKIYSVRNFEIMECNPYLESRTRVLQAPKGDEPC